jgi:hypothetical protein
LKQLPLEEAGDDRGGACFLVAGGGLVEYGLKEKFIYFIFTIVHILGKRKYHLNFWTYNWPVRKIHLFYFI